MAYVQTSDEIDVLDIEIDLSTEQKAQKFFSKINGFLIDTSEFLNLYFVIRLVKNTHELIFYIFQILDLLFHSFVCHFY